MVLNVGQQDGDFDPILDDVSDDDDDPAGVNMEEDDAAHRAPPQPALFRFHRNTMVDLLLLAGYQRIVLHQFSKVYKGIHMRTGATVAIKRLGSQYEDQDQKYYIREISLLRELKHPNIVELLDIIQTHPEESYLIFEFVPFDLKTFMDQHQDPHYTSERVGLPVPTVRSFMRQILAGVGFCHTSRVLHRDLRPSNLLISADGTQLKLADFGLARLSAIPDGPYTTEVVTLWYRAPELLLGANYYSSSVDVWSIGCIFAEMATSRPLFPGDCDIDQVFKIFQRRGTPTAEMWPAVLRLPQYNPEFPSWPQHNITRYVSQQALRSDNAADLLDKLLQYDPDRRISCETALQHAYFLEG